jgi:serine/threonine protein kinase
LRDAGASAAHPARGRIERYVVGDLLGEGGKGRVFAAYDPELDRGVAIKLLHADGEQLQSRLLREGKAMAKLSHPNVVAVHDIGTHAGGLFVAMELVDGVTLKSWLAAAPRSRREIVEVFLQAARGLEAAHAAGIVHRDFAHSGAACPNGEPLR